jgi:hypothetical protein
MMDSCYNVSDLRLVSVLDLKKLTHSQWNGGNFEFRLHSLQDEILVWKYERWKVWSCHIPVGTDIPVIVGSFDNLDFWYFIYFLS